MTASINPSEIPSITALREVLDYGDQHLPRCKRLHDNMRYFRTTFISSKGLEGSSLIDWKSREEQAALAEMTNAFLERDGTGRQFWPDDEASDRFNRLKYSTHHALIKRTVRQLFWRMNLQNHRNTKYRKNKEKKEIPHGEPRAGRGLSHDDPIEVDLASEEDPTSNGGEILESRRSATVASFTFDHAAADKLMPPVTHNGTQSRETGGREARKDPYAVPESPRLDVHIPTDKPLFTVMLSAPQNKTTRSFAPVANMEPSMERSGTNDSTSAFTKSSLSRGRKRPAGTRSSRASPRKRKPRREPEWASRDEYLAAGESSDEVPVPDNSGDGVSAGDDVAPSGSASRISHGLPILPRPSVEGDIDEEIADPSIDEAAMQLNVETELQQSKVAGTEVAKDTADASFRSTPRDTPHREPTETCPSRIALTNNDASPVIVESDQRDQDESAHATSAVKRAPPQKPQVEITYQIVTWYPEHFRAPWVPKGSFRSKTLPELQKEVPMNLDDSHVTGLRFLVKAPGINAKYVVLRDRNEQFNRMKESLESDIRTGVAKAVKDLRLLLDIGITIEVLTDMDSTRMEDGAHFEANFSVDF
ncbi:hypothetical protein RB213_011402 [Colletotrichum asianum]